MLALNFVLFLFTEPRGRSRSPGLRKAGLNGGKHSM